LQLLSITDLRLGLCLHSCHLCLLLRVQLLHFLSLLFQRIESDITLLANSTQALNLIMRVLHLLVEVLKFANLLVTSCLKGYDLIFWRFVDFVQVVYLQRLVLA